MELQTVSDSKHRVSASEELTPAQSAKQAAELALDEASGVLQAAATILSDMAGADPILYEAVMEPWRDRAFYEAVRAISHQRRVQSWSPQPDDSSGLQALAASNAVSLMEFPLWGGPVLGDATMDDVLRAADRYRAQAMDMATKAVWLTLIAERLPAGKRVRHVLKETDLLEMKAHAETE